MQESLDDSCPFILKLNIELTSYCNLSCRWCIADDSRPKGFMTVDLFRDIVNSVIDSSEVKVGELHFYSAGESLLHPRFNKIMEFLGQRWKKNPAQLPVRVISTNSTLLTEEKSLKILKENALDEIIFSVDGGTKERFEWLRRGSKWAHCLKNINRFLDLKEKLNSEIKTSLVSLYLDGMFDQEFIDLIERVDCFMPREAHEWDGSKELENYKHRTVQRGPCYYTGTNLVVLWNGDVTVCCNDLNGRGVLGNIKEHSIRYFWTGPRKKIRELQEQGKRQSIPLCKDCTIWF